MKALAQHRFFLPAAGAVLTAICGLILWGTLLGDRWLDASYDYLFRFGARAVTNKITVILMDDDSFKELNPGQPWDRALHADLLNKLADDGCPLVVLDIFFERTNEPAADNELAAALRRQKAVVLMAEQTSTTHAGQISTSPSKPAALFLEAATNWGAAYLNTNSDGIVRRHWPFHRREVMKVSPGQPLAWRAQN